MLVSPQILKQFNNRWFLFAYGHEDEHDYVTLALDRIISISEASQDYNHLQVEWEEDFFMTLLELADLTMLALLRLS
jgi:hypothetical protein